MPKRSSWVLHKILSTKKASFLKTGEKKGGRGKGGRNKKSTNFTVPRYNKETLETKLMSNKTDNT